MKAVRVVLKVYGETAKDAFSGKSGFLTDGRWHTKGRFLDYASFSRSLATLERLVHYKRFDALAPHVIYTLDIPDEKVEILTPYPTGWDADDPLPAAQSLGNAWYDGSRSPALRAPSATTPGEFNLLINARHANWDWKWVVNGPTKFEFDGRLADLMNTAKKAASSKP